MDSIYKWCDKVLSNISYLNILGGITILFVGVLVLSKCSSTPPVKNTPSLTITEEESYHDAIYQAASIDQSCYDAKTRIWLVHSIKPASGGHWPKGWYYDYHDNFEVIKLGNGSVAITNMPKVLNAPIDPNVTGLSCRTHELKPGDKQAIENEASEQSEKQDCSPS